jgi:hypothetical protein
VRPPAATAHRPARPQPLPGLAAQPDLPIPGIPPPAQLPAATRALQLPSGQLPLDLSLVIAYREHGRLRA